MKRGIASKAIILTVLLICVLALPVNAGSLKASRIASREILFASPCLTPGWFPSGFGLKDHHIFWYNGTAYLISIHLPDETKFAYGRSSDMCEWQLLPPVLEYGRTGAWEEKSVWAPYVIEQGGIFYMYYTGVTERYSQSIMLATSADPADSTSWKAQGMVFQPDHPDMSWSPDSWADCRDPMVLPIDGSYYMLYSGSDTLGGIVGMAKAPSLAGPWIDMGTVLPPMPGIVPESSTLVPYNGAYYLFYSLTGRGGFYRAGEKPTGPWGPELALPRGWAHEVWQNPEGKWYVSYLTDYTVTISPLGWDGFFTPARPFFGSNVSHTLLPLIGR